MSGMHEDINTETVIVTWHRNIRININEILPRLYYRAII